MVFAPRAFNNDPFGRVVSRDKEHKVCLPVVSYLQGVADAVEQADGTKDIAAILAPRTAEICRGGRLPGRGDCGLCDP